MRSRQLNSAPQRSDGSCVAYLMSRDMRLQDNWAFAHAQALAKSTRKPLVVVCNLFPTLGFRQKAHFEFLISGLRQVEKSLVRLQIPFILMTGKIVKNVKTIDSNIKPLVWVTDFSPLHHARNWRMRLAKTLPVAFIEVDAHNIIPSWIASDHEEFAAHTFRRKVKRHLHEYIQLPPQPSVQLPISSTLSKALQRFHHTWTDVEKLIQHLPDNASIITKFGSGETAALRTLDHFIANSYEHYALFRNDPTRDVQSGLSVYLHFGQIWSGRVALAIDQVAKQKIADVQDQSAVMNFDPYIEELIVRKELADNYCLYQRHYRSLAGAKAWARQTLLDHKTDPRTYRYSLKVLREAHTHDKLWNAAQKQMVLTGKMHGYMRMYWAKKILEWTDDLQQAIDIAIELNDTFSADGGDANGYTGIMWSIAGVHDRPWFERPVIGKIRPMTLNGMQRKFNIQAYIDAWNQDL